MKIAVIVAQVVMGLIFVTFGANGLHPFLPMKQLPTGLAGEFLTVFFQSHWVFFVGLVQFVGGLLLLINRYVPLGLTLLGPVIVNIILYHALLTTAMMQPAILVTVLWFFLFYVYRKNFAGLFVAKALN